MSYKSPPRVSLVILFFFILGLVFSLFTITVFPAVHSDEVWLADLSREIIDTGNPAATESFFRLTPRYPHTIKILYHLIQGFFLRFSFSPLTARLPSFLAGLLVLASAGLAARSAPLLRQGWGAIPLFLLWNLQFLYASHFGRQEIFILALFLGGYAVLKTTPPGWKQGGLLGLATAPGIFIHPNIFITALALGFIMVYADLSNRNDKEPALRHRIGGWFLYAGILATAAAAALLISLSWDPDFLIHYRDFGDNHGVGMPLFLKLRRFPRFFYKMFIQAAGTYYLPPLKGVMIIGGLALILRPLFGLLTRAPRPLETSVGTLGLAAGLMIIGKYSPPSLILFLPLAAFALVETLVLTGKLLEQSGWTRAGKNLPLLLGAVLFLGQAASTTHEVYRFRETYSEYQRYEQFLLKTVPPGEAVLANLNGGFVLDTRRIHPYRDLAFLADHGLSVTDYLSREKVGWVIWPEEMEIIYAQRPVWNDLYGNLYPYYDELYALLQSARAADTGFFPVYGMRILPYQHRRGGDVTVYRIILP